MQISLSTAYCHGGPFNEIKTGRKWSRVLCRFVAFLPCMFCRSYCASCVQRQICPFSIFNGLKRSRAAAYGLPKKTGSFFSQHSSGPSRSNADASVVTGVCIVVIIEPWHLYHSSFRPAKGMRAQLFSKRCNSKQEKRSISAYTFWRQAA